MRTFQWILLAAGVGLFGALIWAIGPTAIISSFSHLSWRLLVIVCFPFALVTTLGALGWRFAFTHDRVAFPVLLRVWLAGEAFNATTPTASLGGDGVKAWLLRRHIPYEESLPSLIVAKTTLAVAQGLFLLAGIVLARHTRALDGPLLRMMQWLLVLEAIGVGGFVLVQLGAGLETTERILSRLNFLSNRRGASAFRRLVARLSEFYRREPRRLLLCIGCPFLGWVFSALETYLILYFLDAPVSLSTAAIIEAFITGIRFATFFVPANIGALEGGQVALFVALGLNAATGLAYSLVRRVREAAWVGLGLAALAERPLRVPDVFTSVSDA